VISTRTLRRSAERRGGPVDDGQCRRGGLVHVEGQDNAAVKHAQEGFAGAAQGCVCLRAGTIYLSIESSGGQLDFA
jgi:hypothetical protein